MLQAGLLLLRLTHSGQPEKKGRLQQWHELLWPPSAVCFHPRNSRALEAGGDTPHLQTVAHIAGPAGRLSSLRCSVKQSEEGNGLCQICLQALTEEDRTRHIQVIKKITDPQ